MKDKDLSSCPCLYFNYITTCRLALKDILPIQQAQFLIMSVLCSAAWKQDYRYQLPKEDSAHWFWVSRSSIYSQLWDSKHILLSKPSTWLVPPCRTLSTCCPALDANTCPVHRLAQHPVPFCQAFPSLRTTSLSFNYENGRQASHHQYRWNFASTSPKG